MWINLLIEWHHAQREKQCKLKIVQNCSCFFAQPVIRSLPSVATATQITPMSNPAKIDSLTPAQEQQMLAYRAECLAVGRNTNPADRKTAERVFASFYARLKLPTPKVWWFDGPATGSMARIILAQKNLRANLRANLGANLGADLQANLGANLQANLWDNLGDNLGDNLRADLRDSLRDSLRDNLRTNLWDNLGANLRANLGANLQAHLWINLQDNLQANLWTIWGTICGPICGTICGPI
jgi:hypothetical protein